MTSKKSKMDYSNEDLVVQVRALGERGDVAYLKCVEIYASLREESSTEEDLMLRLILKRDPTSLNIKLMFGLTSFYVGVILKSTFKLEESRLTEAFPAIIDRLMK